ncbi:hypothetical protein SAMN05192539_103162 [Paraburkholderia diazotrophica]|uniref:Uncharacterized protein n=1 Tax=Paraburkholderia diazotrophica TaxID=667676 RepID=A0A1H7DKN6_9BURK|nr:hypothetical protein SAMN05192539_103162 [Paraburkholderia diazotrophica]
MHRASRDEHQSQTYRGFSVAKSSRHPNETVLVLICVGLFWAQTKMHEVLSNF